MLPARRRRPRREVGAGGSCWMLGSAKQYAKGRIRPMERRGAAVGLGGEKD